MISFLTSGGLAGQDGITPDYGPVAFPGGIRFRYYFPHARSIAVAGDFNNWKPTLLLSPMKSSGAFEGILPAEFLLKKTKYRYKLIINGIMAAGSRQSQ